MTEIILRGNKYSQGFKRKVIEPILNGQMNAHQAGLLYGFKGAMTIYRWLKQAERIMSNPSLEEKALTYLPDMEEKDLASENEALRKMLEVERLKSEAYLKMIKLAEEKFSISIEKKFGAKRS